MAFMKSEVIKSELVIFSNLMMTKSCLLIA